jgi:hypothetical protein
MCQSHTASDYKHPLYSLVESKHSLRVLSFQTHSLKAAFPSRHVEPMLVLPMVLLWPLIRLPSTVVPTACILCRWSWYIGKQRHSATQLVRMLQFEPRVSSLGSTAQATLEIMKQLLKVRSFNSAQLIISEVHKCQSILLKFLHWTHFLGLGTFEEIFGANEFVHW